MGISEKKMQIVINNYFKQECDVNTSIREAFEKGFRIGVKKGQSAQPEQKWIPCSERMPDKKESNYWVCTDSGNQCQCRWTNNRYGLGANECSEWGWHVMDKPQYEQVVAWMPLLKPHKA